MNKVQQEQNLIEAMMWLEMDPPKYWIAHALIQQVWHAMAGHPVSPLEEECLKKRAKFFSETAIENAKWSANENQSRTSE